MSTPPSECTSFRLRRASRAVTRLYDRYLAEAGLKSTQYAVLANAARQARPIADLADHLGMERTTLTRNLKPLVEAGWIVLHPGPDPRQRMVVLSASGQAKLESARPFWCAAQQATEAVIGAAQVQALHAQLDAAVAHILPMIDDPRP